MNFSINDNYYDNITTKTVCKIVAIIVLVIVIVYLSIIFLDYIVGKKNKLFEEHFESNMDTNSIIRRGYRNILKHSNLQTPGYYPPYNYYPINTDTILCGDPVTDQYIYVDYDYRTKNLNNMLKPVYQSKWQFLPVSDCNID